jgi:mutator protein MutT
MIAVVAALIESNGKLLVCQRRRGDSFGLKWEFPGGKVKPGENLSAALERELREELGAEAHVGREVFRTRHQYAEMAEAIELVFFSVEMKASAARNLVFEKIEWRERVQLPGMDFLPADRELIEKLARGELSLP